MSLSIFFFLLLPTLTLTLTLTLTHPSPSVYILLINHTTKPHIFPSSHHWYTSLSPTPPLHVYSTILHGFSAVLTPSDLRSLSTHPSVLSIIPDSLRSLHTTRSPEFLNLRTRHGLWSGSDYGSDSIIGILDTGITPNHRSFVDTNLGPVPGRWKGECESGVGFEGRFCNRKLIGARFFSKGHDAGESIGGPGINETIEFRSPKDADGHGTHTASTAAGRHVFYANMSGYASGIAKGVAPKARIAVYKVCWKGSGCMDSDILAGFDAAVRDGVDVVSVSIGGGGGGAPYYLDPIAVGAFGAVARGVLVASSGGNDGPEGMSVTNLAPWLLTVGAGTIDRTFPAVVVLGDGRRFNGVSLYAGKPLQGKMFPLVFPGKTGGLSASLCMENTLDRNAVRGKIIVCERGSNPRVAKGVVVKDAGGIGMILSNAISNGEGLVGDAHVLPACAVGANEGELLKSYIASSPNATATIIFDGTKIGVKPAPVVAAFSGRGPNGISPAILKPDLIAPGVNILAAWADAVGPSGMDNDKRRTEFNIQSGTSMACPHVAGAAALLKSVYPKWSPAAIRSAMMTTTSVNDNRFEVVVDESTGRASTPMDFGAGHLNLERAMDPGLVYDLAEKDYVEFLCSIGYEPKTTQVITHVPVTCPAKKAAPENLNYPSFSIVFNESVGNASKTFIRTATNVGQPNTVYKVKVEMAGKGVQVVVKPWRLVFTEAVKERKFAVTVLADMKSLEIDEAGSTFGYLSWSDGRHVVRSPIVISRVQPL